MALSPQSSALQAEAHAFMLSYLLKEEEAATALAFSMGVDVAQVELGRAGLYDPIAQQFVQSFNFQQVRSFTAQTAAVVRIEVARGIAEGLNQRDLIAHLSARLRGRSRFNLNTIARTELNRAANWGRFSGWKRSGIVQFKEYQATLDGRVRQGHLLAHGEQVPINATFTRGDARGYLMPPIAPNCRCSASAASFLSRDYRSEAVEKNGRVTIVESPRVREARSLQEEFKARNIKVHKGRREQTQLSAACEVHGLGLAGGSAVLRSIPGLRELEDRHAARMESLLALWPRLLFRQARAAVVPQLQQVRRQAR